MQEEEQEKQEAQADVTIPQMVKDARLAAPDWSGCQVVMAVRSRMLLRSLFS